MPEKNPHGVRAPGPDPVHKPIPAGSMSHGAMIRNGLQAADPDADADELMPEAVKMLVDLEHAETGRDPKRPGVI